MVAYKVKENIMYIPKKYLFSNHSNTFFCFAKAKLSLHLYSMHQTSAYARYPDPVSQAGPR